MTDFQDLCPHCDYNLDDGDIYEKMKDAYPDKPEEVVLQYCNDFGWTPENKKRFSKKVGVYSMERDRVLYYECPECKGRVKKTK
jgi:hypothetical protein